MHLKDFLSDWLPTGKFPSGVGEYLELIDETVLQAIRQDSGHRRRILERGHARLVKEFIGKAPLALKTAAKLREQIGSIRLDGFDLSLSGPGEDELMIDRDGQPSDIVANSPLLSKFKATHVDRIYADEDDRDQCNQLLQDMLKGEETSA